MEKFQVEIKFPRNTDSNPNLVTIIGQEENVLDAKEHLRSLEDEYVSNEFHIPLYISPLHLFIAIK